MAYELDMIVIGGGAAGLTAAGVSASLGARTLMVERHRLGGDCTWTGCVPSKTLLKSAKVAHQIRHSSRYGLVDQELAIDFAMLMRRLRTIREGVYDDADRPELYEAMGVEVRHGDAAFCDPHTIEITEGDRTSRVRARFFIIACGASAFVPPIEGLADVDYLTNERLFEIDRLPRRLAIVGGGPIGTEMAQAFCRLGSEVTVINGAGRILPRDDEELARMLQEALAAEGVRYEMPATVQRVSRAHDGIAVEVAAAGDPAPRVVHADALLVATGRRPNLDGLRLGAAGVDYTDRGIRVDDRCRTNIRHIFAVGDVTGRYQFTHMGEHMAKVAATNALLRLPMKVDVARVPWTTYTDPELAHLGAGEAELTRRGLAYEVYRFPYRKIDRAVTEGETIGLIKVYAKRRSGRILGADVLGTGAGELISEYAVAMRGGVTLRRLSDTIHPYPSYALGARRAADQWYVRQHSPAFVRVLQKVFGYRGAVIEYEPGQIV